MKRKFSIIVVILVVAFIGWRFVRPMQIFVVSPTFERPMDTSNAPSVFPALRAEECVGCHRDIYNEWRISIHSQAWTDPYFQVDCVAGSCGGVTWRGHTWRGHTWRGQA
ncbi:MAG: hypothetical protein PVJ72_19330 [Gammaproteobacteria bacterium]